jgi:hypothetical protein
MATSTIPSRIRSRPRPVQVNDVDLLDQRRADRLHGCVDARRAPRHDSSADACGDSLAWRASERPEAAPSRVRWDDPRARYPTGRGRPQSQTKAGASRRVVRTRPVSSKTSVCDCRPFASAIGPIAGVGMRALHAVRPGARCRRGSARAPRRPSSAVPTRHDSPDDGVRPVIGVPPGELSTIRTR